MPATPARVGFAACSGERCFRHRCPSLREVAGIWLLARRVTVRLGRA